MLYKIKQRPSRTLWLHLAPSSSAAGAQAGADPLWTELAPLDSKASYQYIFTEDVQTDTSNHIDKSSHVLELLILQLEALWHVRHVPLHEVKVADVYALDLQQKLG